MSFLDSLAGYAPYVAPIIERNRQRDLQAAMLKQQQDRQATQDRLAAALGQSTISRNAATAGEANARADALRNPVPKVPGVKYITDANGNLIQVPTTAGPSTPSAAPQADETQADISGPMGGQEPKPQMPGVQTTPQQIGTNTGIRMPVKQPAVVKVDPFGPQGVAAKKDLQNNAAANRPAPRVPVQKPMAVADQTDPTKGVFVAPQDAVGRNTVTKPTNAGGLTGGMGTGGIGGIARTSAAITGMAQAEPRMTEFENDPKRQLDGLDYWQKMRANMYDAKGIKDEALHAAVYSHLNQTNPKLANYLRNAETWSLEDSNLSGRASDFRLKLDNFISQIGPNADDTQKATTQNFRKTRLAELQRFQPAMQAIGDRIAGGGRGGQPTQPNVPRGPAKPIDLREPTDAQKLWDAAVAKHGQAKVLQQFGPRPEE